MRMARYWMSGCMALVLLAAGRWPNMGDREESEGRRGWVSITSKYPLEQTARQLQRAAKAQGLPVVFDLPAAVAGRGPQGASMGAEGAGRVLVLGRADGHTPVMQASDAAPVDLPLRVLLKAQPDGSTRVLFNDPQRLAQQDALPDEFLKDLAALPKVVSAALHSPDASDGATV